MLPYTYQVIEYPQRAMVSYELYPQSSILTIKLNGYLSLWNASILSYKVTELSHKRTPESFSPRSDNW